MSPLTVLDHSRGVADASGGHAGRVPRAVPVMAATLAWAEPRHGTSWTRTTPAPAVTGPGIPRLAARDGSVVSCGAGTGAIRVSTRPRNACLGSGSRPVGPDTRPSPSVVSGTAPLPVAA